MTVDAASTGCCCDIPLPSSCLAIWSCSTVQKFRLTYNLGITYRRSGTSAAGLQTTYEHILTLSGTHTYQRAAVAPSFSSSLVYAHVGPSTWTLYSRARWRNFFTSVNCNPCGSTYLAQEQLINASGSSGASPSAAWGEFRGECSTCGCNYPNDPKYIAFKVGGPGSYTRNQTIWNEAGSSFPSTFSGACTCYATVLPPDGCVTPQWFPDCNWTFDRLTIGSGSVLIESPAPPPGCTDIYPPQRCGLLPCDPASTSSSYNASGCAALDADTHVCQSGAGFVCGCDGVETNGCLPTIDTYDKFGTFSITIV